MPEMTNSDMFDKIRSGEGFIAALDQSGGSTPKALRLYGVDESAYSNDEQMFDMVHQMRSRIITSPSFGGDRILGAILFEMTMDKQVEGIDTAQFLWEKKQVVPFLKIDKGLADVSGDVQVMKPNPHLGALLERANAKKIFGTKMRSVIKNANAEGVTRVVDQQFEVAHQIMAAGLVPIIEPEVDIHSPSKAEAEDMLLGNLMRHIGQLKAGQNIMLKLTLPEKSNLYAECAAHPNVVRMVALSGGYSRAEACERLSNNHGMIASFSRALTQGLSAQQDAAQFNATLDTSIQAICDASRS
jgi:fructose-bisphosphate aldolase, class I